MNSQITIALSFPENVHNFTIDHWGAMEHISDDGLRILYKNVEDLAYVLLCEYLDDYVRNGNMIENNLDSIYKAINDNISNGYGFLDNIDDGVVGCWTLYEAIKKYIKENQ